MRKIFTLILLSVAVEALCCTSAIVSGKITASGRPMIWKHRDTGTEHNFVARIEPTDHSHGFVALFNGGDSLLSEAWTGMNDAGFAIMNTASYNLMPDTMVFKDREGELMRIALEKCATLDDFEKLLADLPRPLGVEANFGVMDATGKAAYFETSDAGIERYSLDDEESGIIYRTNYSYSGRKDDGYGYIREATARHLIDPLVMTGNLRPEDFTEGVSRSFYHSLIGRDFMDGADKWIIDQDFVPRKSSSASIVIEGILPGESPESMTMWTVIGYPPVGHVEAVTIDNVPAGLQPLEEGWRSADCNESLKRKSEVFSIKRGSGSHYLDLEAVRKHDSVQRRLSKESYAERRNERDKK